VRQKPLTSTQGVLASGGSRTTRSDVNVNTEALDSQHCQIRAMLIIVTFAKAEVMPSCRFVCRTLLCLSVLSVILNASVYRITENYRNQPI